MFQLITNEHLGLNLSMESSDGGQDPKSCVFLGGTTGSRWRDRLMPMLTVPYFNPIVAVWDEESQANEIHHRETCEHIVYVVTSKMSGFYAIAEMVEDSMRRPEKTLCCFLDNDDGAVFTTHQKRSVQAMRAMLERHGTVCYDSLEDLANAINQLPFADVSDD